MDGGLHPGQGGGGLDGRRVAAIAALASGLWRALMNYVSRDLPPDGWTQPQGMIAMDVCSPSGLLPTDACPLVVREIFLEGNQPVQYDDLYRTFPINRETKLLATIFTPPELVENKVFMVVPEAAREWAVSAGLLTPPDTYDTIQAKPPTPDVNIASPEMFADSQRQGAGHRYSGWQGFSFLPAAVWAGIESAGLVPDRG